MSETIVPRLPKATVTRGSGVDKFLRRSVRCTRHQQQTRQLGNVTCFVFIGKQPQIDPLAVCSKRDLPLPDALVPADASIPRRPKGLRAILSIADLAYGAQVASPAIQAVTVDVVNSDRILSSQSQKPPMQVDGGLFPVEHLAAPSVATGVNRPAQLRCSLGIDGINDGIRANQQALPAALPRRSAIQGDTCRPIRAGIIRVHRVPPVPCATPPAATNSAGVSCCNFTSRVDVVSRDSPRKDS